MILKKYSLSNICCWSMDAVTPNYSSNWSLNTNQSMINYKFGKIDCDNSIIWGNNTHLATLFGSNFSATLHMIFSGNKCVLFANNGINPMFMGEVIIVDSIAAGVNHAF